MAARIDDDETPGPGLAVSLRTPRRAALLAAFVAAAGCYDQLLVPDTETDGRLTVTNDEGALCTRLTYLEEEVGIEPPAALFGGSAAIAAQSPSLVELTLIGELGPPTVEGEVVQATSLSRQRSTAVLVSYNMRGAPFLGAVDYLTNLHSKSPRVSSSVQFADSDISAVALDGSFVYAAQATGAVDFASPAALERMVFGFSGLELGLGDRVDLASFAATSVQVAGSEVYVTTGSQGSVYALAETDLSVLAEYELGDARWVEEDAEGGRIVVVQGTPGRISVFREGSFAGGTLELLATYPFPGADVPESKSAMDIAGGKAFIAAGPEGVQVMCLDSGEIIGNVPRPDPDRLGLDPSVVVTNAVAADDDLLFISNGEAGVYVAAGADDWQDTDCAPQSITMLGRLQFGSLESVNHVDYRNNTLLVAAGLGGVKIVRVKAR